MRALIFLAGMVSPWSLLIALASLMGHVTINDRDASKLTRLLLFIPSLFVFVWSLSMLF